jgi:hypothetical protein
MSPTLLPALDPTPLPAPAWLFHALLVGTFFVHVLFMNVALGGSVIGAFHALLGRGSQAPGRALGRMLLSLLSPALAFTITTGVAPLLFVQLLYAQTFYPATVLVGWIWLGLLAVLMVGYYAVYLARFEVGGRDSAPAWAAVTAISLVAIALIQVLVNVLQLTPDRWTAVGVRLVALFGDPTILPRYLHFLLGSLAVAGLFLAILAGERHRKTPDPVYPWIAARGVRWALAATGLQMADGIWLLFALPEELLRSLMRGRFPETPTLAIGLGLGFLTLILLSRTLDPLRQRSLLHGAAASLLATLLAMIPLRDMVRSLYLAPLVRPQGFPVQTQADVLTIFLLLFVGGLATVGWMIIRVVRERRASA